MARTVNRRPVEVPVNTPKDYFFNHLEWKGLNTSKNILTVDQETFSNCNNVYVDSNNILTSRPPIVAHKQYKLTNVVNVWTFADTLAIHYLDGNTNKITFYKDTIRYGTFNCMEHNKLIFVEGKIFVFSDSTFGFFDTDNLTHGNMYYVNNAKVTEGVDPEKYIYIPNTVISTNSIRANNEYKNELTAGENITYNYSSNAKIDFNDLLGKSVTLSIAGEKYKLDNFKLDNEKVIVQPTAIAPADIIKYCNEMGTFISYNKSRNVISYSPDGVIWETLPNVSGIIGEPYLTNNGSHCIVFKADGYYIFDLAKNIDGVYTNIDERGNRIWAKVDYDFPDTEEYLDVNFVPTAEFDTIDIYSYIVRTNAKTYFKINNPDTSKLHDISVLSMIAVGKVRFTRFAGRGTHLAISYIAGPLDNYGNYEFFVSAYKITLDGTITLTGTSRLTYEGQSLTDVNLNTDVTHTDLKITWDSVSDEYDILLAGGVGTSTSVADVYWSITVNGSLPLDVNGVPMVQDFPLRTPSLRYLISDRDGSILTDRYLYVNDTVINLLPFNIGSVPISNDAYLINSIGKQLYANYSDNNILVTMTLVPSKVLFKKFYNYVELNQHFISSGQYLYITQDRRNDDGEYLWYLPTVNTQKFNYDITNLHVLSKEDVAIFFNNEIWYVTPIVTDNLTLYNYNKSKLQVGVLQGSDVITSYDGKHIMFGTDKGLVAMAYQDFVASTEQTLTYLSDNIHPEWNEFSKKPIQLFAHLHWIFCYQLGNSELHIFDTRNGSWWPWSYSKSVNKIVDLNKNVIILADTILREFGDFTDYSDDDSIIDWYIESQLLHLSAINNYKHISNITLNSVSNNPEPFTCILDITNYRDVSKREKASVLEYNIDMSRTYVKRLNFSKVNQLQYKLSNDRDNVNQLPLSLTSIVIKYGIKERVR